MGSEARAVRKRYPSDLTDAQWELVKPSEMGGPRDCDGGKKINGRQRHVAVDTSGLLLAVAVTTANLDDRTHAPKVLKKPTPEKLPRLKVVCGDNRYKNHKLGAWIAEARARRRQQLRAARDTHPACAEAAVDGGHARAALPGVGRAGPLRTGGRRGTNGGRGQ